MTVRDLTALVRQRPYRSLPEERRDRIHLSPVGQREPSGYRSALHPSGVSEGESSHESLYMGRICVTKSRASDSERSMGTIKGADTLTIEVIQPASMPAVVRIVWPTAATITTPAHYREVASAAMRLLAEASTTLARIRASRRL